MKGETPEERTAIAQVMRGHAQHIPTEIHDAMDNCVQVGTSLSALTSLQLQPLSWQVVEFTWLNMEIVLSLLNLVQQMSCKLGNQY